MGYKYVSEMVKQYRRVIYLLPYGLYMYSNVAHFLQNRDYMQTYCNISY